MTGTLAVLFDVALEPVAMRFDYWDWAGGTVPAAVVIIGNILGSRSAAISTAL